MLIINSTARGLARTAYMPRHFRLERWKYYYSSPAVLQNLNAHKELQPLQDVSSEIRTAQQKKKSF